MGDCHREDGSSNGKNDVPPAIIPNSDTAPSATTKEPNHFKLVNEIKTNIGCWNVRRGLLKRETDIKNLIADQKLDILFLVETDTNSVTSEKDYIIPGFKTWLPVKNELSDKTRLIVLTNLNKFHILPIHSLSLFSFMLTL